MMSLIQFNKDKIKDFSCISVVLNFSFEDLTTIKDYNAIRLNLNGLPIGVMVRLQVLKLEMKNVKLRNAIFLLYFLYLKGFSVQFTLIFRSGKFLISYDFFSTR